MTNLPPNDPAIHAEPGAHTAGRLDLPTAGRTGKHPPQVTRRGLVSAAVLLYASAPRLIESEPVAVSVMDRGSAPVLVTLSVAPAVSPTARFRGADLVTVSEAGAESVALRA